MTIDQPHGLELVNLRDLAAWMDGQGLGSGPIVDVVQLTGGSQNVLLRFKRNGRGYVLRRPPANPRHDGNDTMRREARVLKALRGSDVPHAGLIAACDDASVLGAAFYLMEPLEGFNAAVGMPALHAGSPQARRAMGLSVIDGLSRIALVDYEAVGLGDFGKPDGFLERQARRWMKQLDSYDEFEGWPGAGGLPDVQAIGAWLEQHRPQTFRPGLMHGDFHLKNILFAQDAPTVEAVIDWELSTIGDPLVDLGWLLATWPGPGGDMSQTTIVVQPWDGFPESEELVEVYGRLTGADLSSLNWYRVFACYKLALILEGSYARACAGKAPMEIGQRLHGNAVRLLGRAGRWIEGRQT
ncbi:MAG: phosphotransferase family protein [Caulobacter sp. 12-67-6]|nr:MAG: phosphotransferase family protein [Caulobacter sp. 12-67-6]